MRFLKHRAVYVVTAFMIIISIIAVLIGVRVTVTAVERQDQEVRKAGPAAEDAEQASSKVIPTAKITEQKLYFNGMEVEGIDCFVSDKKEILVSMDDVLRYIGADYRFYAPDDLLETKINGKKLTLRIGKDRFSFDGKGIRLPYAPVAFKGHILVPLEMFSRIDGFGQHQVLLNNSVFLNYFYDMQEIKSSKLKLLRLSEGVGGIWDLTAGRSLWNRKGSFTQEETFEASSDGNAYLLKSGGQAYMINPELHPDPFLLNVDSGYTWSGDGKSLFKEDGTTGAMSSYNIEKDYTTQLDNFSWRAENMEGYEGFSKLQKKLLEFVEYGSYRKTTLQGLFSNQVYSIIQKNGRITAEGKILPSPDREKILFNKPDGGYYTANFDGTGAVKLQNGYRAGWISNTRLFVDNGQKIFLYDAAGRVADDSDARWKPLGKAADGAFFYTDGETLYAELDGAEKKIMPLLWECDSVTAFTQNGPYILASKREDGIFYSDGSGITRVGKYNALLKQAGPLQVQEDLKKSMQISPAKNSILLLQRENRALSLNLFRENERENKKIRIDYSPMDIPIPDLIRIKWIGNERILLYTRNELWVVDFQDPVQVYKYKEKEGCSIEGVISTLK